MESAIARSYPTVNLKPLREPRRWPLAEFLRREDNAAERHEYYDGIIKTLPMARAAHNEIAVNFSAAIKIAVKNSPVTYRVFGNQQMVWLPLLNYGLYPDAIVVCEKPVFHDENQVLMLNPLLIIEVLSKSTRHYDQKSKFEDYKTIPSFKEYVLVEQDFCRIESRFREEPGLWRDSVAEDLTGSILLKSIGCAILLADIYEHIEFKPASENRGLRK